jgi:hypothetical protein
MQDRTVVNLNNLCYQCIKIGSTLVSEKRYLIETPLFIMNFCHRGFAPVRNKIRHG